MTSNLSEHAAARLSALAVGLPEMLESARAVAAHLKSLAEGVEPEHDLAVVSEWAEDLAADLATLESELGDIIDPAEASPPAG